jgi:hypothetical protein
MPLSFPLVEVDAVPSGVEWIGHGCGPIAPVDWLVTQPELCSRVSSWYVDNSMSDPWDRSANAQELDKIAARGGCMSRRARRLLAWWERSGRPAPWKARMAGVPYQDVCAWPVEVFVAKGYVA